MPEHIVEIRAQYRALLVVNAETPQQARELAQQEAPPPVIIRGHGAELYRLERPLEATCRPRAREGA